MSYIYYKGRYDKMGLLTNSDFYTAEVNPDKTVNPKTVGAVWINYNTGVTFVCKDNTKNENVWENNRYPVGAVYLSMDDTDPATLFGGTWRREAGDRTLWLSSSGAGQYLEAGLPNITGTLAGMQMNDSHWWSGAFKDTYYINHRGEDHSKYRVICSNFNAGNSNPIYGKSDTVQPPALRVYCWVRTA